jgi:hypothetical protein
VAGQIGWLSNRTEWKIENYFPENQNQNKNDSVESKCHFGRRGNNEGEKSAGGTELNWCIQKKSLNTAEIEVVGR